MKVNFNKAYCGEKELENIKLAFSLNGLSGDNTFTKKCNEWFQKKINRKILLTTSCTSALDMMAILIDAKEGDEIIMPSYTFVSTANAFVLRGAKPVFVDIRPDTKNIDENLIEQAITPNTKAIIVVHYAGVPCEMDKIQAIAKKHGLYLLEDAAQGFGSSYKGKLLGTIGDLGTYSFHETKNIISGEGGCLIINNSQFDERAEIIREKGTNRSKFFRGQVDKYTWVDIGSSYLPSDIISAFLYAQLNSFDEIQKKRMLIWNKYNNFFEKFEKQGLIQRPVIPLESKHNAHMYYILFKDLKTRTMFIDYLKQNDISSVFHYIPLHSAPAGQKFGRTGSDMRVTDIVSDTLVRLPLYYELTDMDLDYIFN
ncbi:dTDP-4-amino-4,6-dideoxygalactose transaminase, partial [bacterium]|nr:dTDP-4-amino-4,6-dideoxygalactose transaminase [bacterium]